MSHWLGEGYEVKGRAFGWVRCEEGAAEGLWYGAENRLQSVSK